MTTVSETADVLHNQKTSFNSSTKQCRIQWFAGAMEDLNKALELSKRRGKTACLAFTQRGCILRKLGKDDDARADFEAAAQLGSPFAKIQVDIYASFTYFSTLVILMPSCVSQAVQLNPYAALCNKMLHDVIEKLHNPRNDTSSEN